MLIRESKDGLRQRIEGEQVERDKRELGNAEMEMREGMIIRRKRRRLRNGRSLRRGKEAFSFFFLSFFSNCNKYP